MKMAKKLLALALAGVLALSVLTGCGNSTGTGSIADAMSDMFKVYGTTVKSDSKLNAKAQETVAALEKAGLMDELVEEYEDMIASYKSDQPNPLQTIVMNVMKDYDDQFVFIAMTRTKGYNATAQAYSLWESMDIINWDSEKLENKEPGNTRYIGTTTLTKNGVGYRFAILTAEPAESEGGEDGGDIEL